jgi:hypothetical protein
MTTLQTTAIEASAGGRLEMFVPCVDLVTPNGARCLDLIMGFGATSPQGPWHIWQTAPNNGWSQRYSHGKPTGFNAFPPWH